MTPLRDMKVTERIGRNIRVMRTERAMTQESLADLAALDATYISGIELGKHNITLATLLKIAKALKCDISVLLRGVKTDFSK